MDIFEAVTRCNLPDVVKAEVLEALQLRSRLKSHKRATALAQVLIAVLIDLKHLHGDGAALPFTRKSLEELEARKKNGESPHVELEGIDSDRPTAKLSWMKKNPSTIDTVPG